MNIDSKPLNVVVGQETARFYKDRSPLGYWEIRVLNSRGRSKVIGTASKGSEADNLVRFLTYSPPGVHQAYLALITP